MSFVFRADRPLRTREQIAREVHAVSLGRGLDELATVIALITISTEVGAEDHTGERQWWCPFNTADPQTEQFAHDSQSDDALSSGYFQQQVSAPGSGGRPWGWGGLFGDVNGARKRMTLAESAELFLAALSDDYIAARDNPQLAGQFAQRVQGSAFPDRYASKWDEAWEVLRRALTTGPVTPTVRNPDAAVATQTGDPIWLEDVLRPALGNRLATLPGWQTSGHGNFKDIRGVMVHHTGNSCEKAESIRAGRPDLAGPLANLHIAPDGTVTIVAVGVCWHAGQGSYPWLPTNNANWHMIGIECAWPTIGAGGSYDKGERWPDAQIISMRDTCAALALKLGVSSDHVIGHKEYAGAAQGKWDPGNIDMNWFRGEVAKDMRGEFAVKPAVVPTPTPVVAAPVVPTPVVVTPVVSTPVVPTPVVVTPVVVTPVVETPVVATPVVATPVVATPTTDEASPIVPVLNVPPPPEPSAPVRLAQAPNPRSDRELLEEIWTALRGPEGNGWPQFGGKSLVDYLASLTPASPCAACAAREAAAAPEPEPKPKKAPAKRAAKRTATKRSSAARTDAAKAS